MKNKTLLSLLLIANCFRASSQNSLEITFENPIPSQATQLDTSWSIQNIECSLSVGWIENVTSTDQGENYYIFGGGQNANSGKFKVDFSNFLFHIDSLHFDVYDACGKCFNVIAFDNTNGNFDLEAASILDYGEDTLFYHNPSQNSNPDSLVLETWEGGFRRLIVYYSEELVGLSKEIEENSPIRVINNQLQFPTGNSNKNFDLKIFDINGKEVMNFNSCAISTIDLSQLNSGIYFASIFDQKSKQRTFSKKIAIIH